MPAIRASLYLAAAALFAASAMSAHAEDGPVALESAAIAFDASDAAAAPAGRLRWLGGLHLTAKDERVGGLSGLRWLGGNRFLAISDEGDWLRFDTEEADGKLTGVGAARIGRLSDENGAPLISKALADAEALTIAMQDGKPARATVYFERSHRGTSYALDEDGGIAGPGKPVALGAFTQILPANEGLEAVAGLPGGPLYIPEGGRGDDGRIRAWRRVMENGKPSFKAVYLDLPAPYKPTDAQALSDGSVLLLSRHFSAMDGVSMRLDRYRQANNGKWVRSALARFAPPVNVDNMEGLAIRQENGRTFVYLLSDNNFQAIQRTLLLKFELVAPKPGDLPKPKLPAEKPGPAKPAPAPKAKAPQEPD